MTDSIGLLCTSPARGGIELNVIRMARWLADMGNRVIVIGKTGTGIAELCHQLALPFEPLPVHSKYFDFRSAWRLRQIVRANGLHFILVNTTADIYRAVITKIFAAGSLKLVYLQNMQIGVKKRDVFHTWIYKHLDAWISPLPYLADQVRVLTKFHKSKIHEIHLGIELERFIDDKPDKIKARRILKLPENAIIAGVIGRLDRQKEQDLLLRAAAGLIHEGIPVEILIVGESTLNESNSYAAQLKLLCAALSITEHVHFRPFMEKIELAHAALDIFVLTSRNETFGLVTIEAMASELAIIATRSGGTPEILTDQKDGLLVTPGSISEVKAALLRMINFPDFRSSLAKAARRKAVESFSHLNQCLDMANLFEKIS